MTPDPKTTPIAWLVGSSPKLPASKGEVVLWRRWGPWWIALPPPISHPRALTDLEGTRWVNIKNLWEAPLWLTTDQGVVRLREFLVRQVSVATEARATVRGRGLTEEDFVLASATAAAPMIAARAARKIAGAIAELQANVRRRIPEQKRTVEGFFTALHDAVTGSHPCTEGLTYSETRGLRAVMAETERDGRKRAAVKAPGVSSWTDRADGEAVPLEMERT